MRRQTPNQFTEPHKHTSVKSLEGATLGWISLEARLVFLTLALTLARIKSKILKTIPNYRRPIRSVYTVHAAIHSAQGTVYE